MAVRHLNRRSPDSEHNPALARLALDLGLYGRGIKPRGGSGASDLKREDVHAAVGRQPEIEAGTDWKFPEPHVLIAMRRSREDDGRRVAALVRERQAAPQSARGVSYALASTEQAAPMLPVARHSAGGGVGRMSLPEGSHRTRAAIRRTSSSRTTLSTRAGPPTDQVGCGGGRSAARSRWCKRKNPPLFPSLQLLRSAAASPRAPRPSVAALKTPPQCRG